MTVEHKRFCWHI